MKRNIINVGKGDCSLPLGVEEMIALVKKVGWDGFFVCWNEETDLEKIAALAKKYDLYFHSVHAPFGGVAALWEEGDEGDKEVEMQIRCLEDSARVGVKLVVLHAIIGMEKCTPTELGVKRFKKIVERAKRLGVKIALENTEGEMYLERLLNAFQGEEAVGFCIDTGHEMCYNGRRDLIKKYAAQLCTTHLNDNFGQTGEKITWMDDSHVMPFDGAADWPGIAKRLKEANYRGDFVYELTMTEKPERSTHAIYEGLDYEGFVALALKKANEFKKLYEEV